MASCKVCLALFKKNQFKVTCVDCSCEFHGKCVKMSQADMDFLSEEGKVWRCDPCGATRRRSMRLEYAATEGGVTLETIMQVLGEIQQEQKRIVADFNKSYEALDATMNVNTTTLTDGMGRIEEFIKEIDKLKSENTFLKTKVETLEARVEDLEMYSRRNCLEIQGVPEENGESVVEVVKKVGSALDFVIEDTMIDACHRIGRRTAGRDQPRGIIVKFVRRTDKELIMKRRRDRKRDFSTRHLDLPMDNPIYLNDSLSPARRRLLAQARQIRREKGFKYIWLRNGNILLRKEEGSPVIEIKTQADLREL